MSELAVHRIPILRVSTCLTQRAFNCPFFIIAVPDVGKITTRQMESAPSLHKLDLHLVISLDIIMQNHLSSSGLQKKGLKWAYFPGRRVRKEPQVPHAHVERSSIERKNQGCEANVLSTSRGRACVCGVGSWASFEPVL